MTKPGPSVTSGADTQPGSDSLFPSGFGGGSLIRAGGVGTSEIADGSVALVDLGADVKATIPLTTPSVSTATTGTLAVGTVNRLDATAASLARTLPAAASAGPGGIVVVKKMDAGANAVTVTRAGSDTINTSGTSRALSLPFEAVHLRSDGVSDWTVVASDTPVSQLDARYSGTYAAIADALATARIDRDAAVLARTRGGAASVAYSDATELTQDWTNLTGWSAATNAQVSGNRLYAVSGTNPGGALKSFTLTGNFHLQALLYWKTGGSGDALYFGIDCGSADHAPAASSPDGAYIGVGSAHVFSKFIGANLGAIELDVKTIGSLPAADTTLVATVDGDANYISFSVKPLGSTTVAFSYKLSRATLTGLGKTPTNISCFIQDARGTSGGNSFSPLLIVQSAQQTRTKTLASTTIEGVDTRHVVTRSASSADPWRVALPASYDARKPTPLVIYFHQSLSGDADSAWSESRAQPVAAALSAAGYIVAAASDGGTTSDRWGNATSLGNYLALYQYVRDRYNVGPLLCLGVSMGALPLLNSIVRRTMPTPAAVATVGGVVDMSLLYAQGAYTAGITSAYSISGDFAAKTAGYSPIDRSGYEFRGVPMRFYSSTGDTTVPKASHTDLLAAKVAAYAPESSTVLGTGTHLDPSQFQGSDLVSFFGTYV